MAVQPLVLPHTIPGAFNRSLDTFHSLFENPKEFHNLVDLGSSILDIMYEGVKETATAVAAKSFKIMCAFPELLGKGISFKNAFRGDYAPIADYFSGYWENLGIATLDLFGPLSKVLPALDTLGLYAFPYVAALSTVAGLTLATSHSCKAFSSYKKLEVIDLEENQDNVDMQNSRMKTIVGIIKDAAIALIGAVGVVLVAFGVAKTTVAAVIFSSIAVSIFASTFMKKYLDPKLEAPQVD